jgi:hypothetical protein
MEHTDIRVAVLAHGMDVMLATEPDKLPVDIAPYALCGFFRYRGPDLPVECTAHDRHASFLMGVALAAFAEHVAKVTEQDATQVGDSVAFLERLHKL